MRIYDINYVSEADVPKEGRSQVIIQDNDSVGRLEGSWTL
jgi:hypothetical protein